TDRVSRQYGNLTVVLMIDRLVYVTVFTDVVCRKRAGKVLVRSARRLSKCISFCPYAPLLLATLIRYIDIPCEKVSPPSNIQRCIFEQTRRRREREVYPPYAGFRRCLL